MNSRASELTQTIWYVLAEGRVWGPYAYHRLVIFAKEGRLSPQTQIGVGPDGPFAAAGTEPELLSLFGISDQKTSEQPSISAKESDGGQSRSPETGPDRALLAYATLVSLNAEAFEAALAQHGRFERIAPELWLVKTRVGAAVLRNALSRRLRTADALLVVEAHLDQAAWFNLDQAGERRLRALWAEG